MRSVSITTVTAALVLTVVLAACSGDGGGAETTLGTATSSTSLAVTTTTTVTTSTTGETTTTLAPTSTTEASTTTTIPTTTGTATTTTAADPAVFYAIDWADPMAPDPLPGSDGSLGSGCTPGTDQLGDGIWAGWIIDRASSSFEFDLACMGEEPDGFGLSNQSTRLRTVTVSATTIVYPVTTDGGTGPATPYPDAQPSPWCGPGSISPSLPDGCPVWVYVNSGIATEIFEFWIS